MNQSKNIHEGHRKRLTDKVLYYPESLADHELLEYLLFPALARIDTNPLAHKLLETFGDINGVFSASAEQLMAVKGMGEKTAAYIRGIAQAQKRLIEIDRKKEDIVVNTTEAIVKILSKDFNSLTKEKCEILLLDKKHKILFRLFYSNDNPISVSIDLREVLKAIRELEPAYAVIAHNHLGKSSRPSPEDDMATEKFYAFCLLNGVKLVEHIIFGREYNYSYRGSGKLEKYEKTIEAKGFF